MSDQSGIKLKQINIRLTADQERLLKQYCVRNDLSTQQAAVAALALLIPAFVGTGNDQA